MQELKEVVAAVEEVAVRVAVAEVEVAAAMEKKHHHLVLQVWVLSSKTWCHAQLCKNLRKNMKLGRSDMDNSLHS